MGLIFSKPKPKQINILGLDYAGKSHMIYKFQSDPDKIQTVIPTIGLTLETTEHRGLLLYSWDFGGRSRLRPLEKHYYKECEGVVYVLDSTDRETLSNSENPKRSSVHLINEILTEDMLLGRPLLIFANKQDLPNCIPLSELIETMGLDKISDRQWKVQPCSVQTGEGLEEGWNWIISQVSVPAPGAS
eukprot:TRINITY_DN2462_c0_g3_i1.p1 TRINITY_DN2462_c0_g3~~TRINITY_DN2462_c0_g3_i1.p1  ORF type:complete len:188 (+),score=20.30 TRINITY_DN2462_c0_g3_i1:126-689(+)